MTPAERLIWFRHANVGRSRALWEEGVDAMLGAPGLKRKRPARERGGGEGGGGMPGEVRRLPVCAAVAVGGWAQKCTRAFEVTP